MTATTRTYYPIIERTVADRRTIRVLGYSDTRIMPPDMDPTNDDSTEIVIGKETQR